MRCFRLLRTGSTSSTIAGSCSTRSIDERRLSRSMSGCLDLIRSTLTRLSTWVPPWRTSAVMKQQSRATTGRLIVSPHILLQLSIDAASSLACTRRFVAHEIPIGPRLPPARKSAQSERIGLAYCSGDFRRHPVAYLIPGLLERHDRSRFDVIGVSFGPNDRSEIRTRIEHAVDQFHDVRSRSDAEIAALLRELGVDIVIDLTGHTEVSR